MTLKQTIITTLIIAIFWLMFAWVVNMVWIQKQWPLEAVRQIAAIP
jgi:hypothetical protein